MAEEALVGLRELTRALNALMEEYAEKGRTFTLVMVIPGESSSPAGNHTLMVSAPWLDEKDPLEAVNTILYSLIDHLGSTQSVGYRKLARISVIRSTDPFVETVTTLFPVLDGKPITIQHQEFSGVLIERAILLRSQSPDWAAST